MVTRSNKLDCKNDSTTHESLLSVNFYNYFNKFTSRMEYVVNPQISYPKRERILTQGDHAPNTLLPNILAEVSVSRNLTHTLFVGETSRPVDISHWSL